MDCVNPQGRKNVPTPTMMGIRIAPHFFRKTEKTELGSVRVFLNIPARLRPSNIITREARIQSIAEKRKFIPIAFPIIPSSPPKRAKPSILELWKRIIEVFPCTPWLPNCADRERMSPPTTARQLETDAMSQSIKLVVGVMLPSMEKLRMPDFCSTINSMSTIIPIGIACQIRPLFSSFISFSEIVYPCFWRRGAIFII
jgi:hypothetical protein